MADSTGQPDEYVEVPIEMNATGTEVTIQFTLHFDPAVLSIDPTAGANVNPDVILAEGAPEGTRVIVNTSDIDNGNIGVVVNFNGEGVGPAVTVGPGALHVVSLRFMVSAGVLPGATTEIAFNDEVFETRSSDSLGRPVTEGMRPAGITIR